MIPSVLLKLDRLIYHGICTSGATYSKTSFVFIDLLEVVGFKFGITSSKMDPRNVNSYKKNKMRNNINLCLTMIN